MRLINIVNTKVNSNGIAITRDTNGERRMLELSYAITAVLVDTIPLKTEVGNTRDNTDDWYRDCIVGLHSAAFKGCTRVNEDLFKILFAVDAPEAFEHGIVGHVLTIDGVLISTPYSNGIPTSNASFESLVKQKEIFVPRDHTATLSIVKSE